MQVEVRKTISHPALRPTFFLMVIDSIALGKPPAALRHRSMSYAGARA